MGLINIDDVASFAIGKTEEKLQGTGEQEKTSIVGTLIRFFVSVIWFFVAFIASLGGFYAMMGGGLSNFLGGDGKPLFIFGIGLCLAVFIITMLIPYLRKKGSFTRWCGIVCLGDALWWIYLLVTGSI